MVEVDGESKRKQGGIKQKSATWMMQNRVVIVVYVK